MATRRRFAEPSRRVLEGVDADVAGVRDPYDERCARQRAGKRRLNLTPAAI